MEHSLFIEFIERRFQRMEDKFDKYFLWGYGTMLSIFVGVLVWILNRINVPSDKEMHPPTSGHPDGKQKYLFPVKSNWFWICMNPRWLEEHDNFALWADGNLNQFIYYYGGDIQF